ncbi:MAG: ElyC/SanA/YdcF family protein [Bacteroidota bacterium]
MNRKFVIISSLLAIVCSFSLLLADWTTKKGTTSRLYDDIEAIPFNKVGLLLGTGKYLANGYINGYYQYRLEAAVELFQQQKIQYLLISGDNSRKDYNEPEQFKQDLLKRGIPADRIFLDYAGFRTLDSVVRAKAIFGQRKLTIISQPFHNERALYICKNKDIEAIGFNAKDVNFRYGLKVQIREKLARLKMMVDLYLTRKQPKYLGKKILIS